MSNTTSSITGLQGFESDSMDQLWSCMNLEQAFTEIKRSDDSFLSDSQTLIFKSDSEELCKLVE